MPQGTKIATCCYCGTRAALKLMGTERHELACSSCGAPLHELKQMPIPATPSNRVKSAPKKPAKVTSHEAWAGKQKKSSKKKKRKSFIWDLLEDAIEEIFD